MYPYIVLTQTKEVEMRQGGQTVLWLLPAADILHVCWHLNSDHIITKGHLNPEEVEVHLGAQQVEASQGEQHIGGPRKSR